MEKLKQIELISSEIYSEAIKLTSKNYTELDMVGEWDNCDSIATNHEQKTFWFTNKQIHLDINKNLA